MTQPPVLEPADRLERLEQESKQLASLLKTANSQISLLQLALLLITAGVAGAGYYAVTTGKLRIEGLSPPSKTVEAQEFGFYNRAGTRVMFDSDDKFGNPEIIFLDTKKKLRMRLLVFPDGGGTGGMALYDHTGWRAFFRMDGDMSSVLRLKGENQKGGIDMVVDRDGNPSVKLTDKSGKLLWQAPTKSN